MRESMRRVSALASVSSRSWSRSCITGGTGVWANSVGTERGWLFQTRRPNSSSDASSASSKQTRVVCYGGNGSEHLGLPFALTSEDAHQSLRKWSKQKPFRPWSLRDGVKSSPTLKPVFLPHWVFVCEVSVKYRGKVGYEAGGGKMEWTNIATWRDGGSTRYESSHPETQVCASFKHRRDLVTALHGKHVGRFPDAKTNGMNDAERNENENNFLKPMSDKLRAVLDASKAGVGPPDAITVERFGMKRSLAWELAFRRVRDNERKKAKTILKEKHKADAVKDIGLDIVLSPGRRVRAVLLPAYIATFTHGETRGPSGDFSPRRHTAVVCGVTGNVVVDEDVVDVGKTRALSVVGGVFLPAFIAGAVFGSDVYGLLAAQASLGSAVAFAVAGAVARRVPVVERERLEQIRVSEETEAFAAAMRHGGPGDRAWMDESTQLRRDDAEWGRWKETDKHNWDEQKREEWAANIWQWQKLRKREREERRAHLELERFRQEEAERRDEEKERRWGPGWRKATGAGIGRGGGGGGRDVKGFYKLLGLREKLSDATELEIKDAYRKEAMAWHPDKHQGDDAKTRAAKTFRELQKAYQVLGNKVEREVYDGL